jgi:thymidine kinase
MFLENSFSQDQPGGWIEVIAGSMFSGKTEELIRRLKRARIARQEVAIFKPAVDTRYSVSEVVSHDSRAVESVIVRCAADILPLCEGVFVIGIDEAQFFDAGLVAVCSQLANEGRRVIVAGLDMDFRGQPFGPMPGLMAVAEYVTKVHAVCMRCGELANHSHRLSAQDALVVLGETDQYEPLCRACYNAVMG